MNTQNNDILDNLVGSPNPSSIMPRTDTPVSENVANNKITADTNFMADSAPHPMAVDPKQITMQEVPQPDVNPMAVDPTTITMPEANTQQQTAPHPMAVDPATITMPEAAPQQPPTEDSWLQSIGKGYLSIQGHIAKAMGGLMGQLPGSTGELGKEVAELGKQNLEINKVNAPDDSWKAAASGTVGGLGTIGAGVLGGMAAEAAALPATIVGATGMAIWGLLAYGEEYADTHKQLPSILSGFINAAMAKVPMANKVLPLPVRAAVNSGIMAGVSAIDPLIKAAYNRWIEGQPVDWKTLGHQIKVAAMGGSLMGGVSTVAHGLAEGKGETTAEKPFESLPHEGAVDEAQSGLDKMNVVDQQYKERNPEQFPEQNINPEAQTGTQEGAPEATRTDVEPQSDIKLSPAPEETKTSTTGGQEQGNEAQTEGAQPTATEPQTTEGKSEAEAAPESYAALKGLGYPDNEIVAMDAGKARDIIENGVQYKPESLPKSESLPDTETATPEEKEKEFVKASDGTNDFSYIDKDVADAIGEKEAPIRLQVGNEKYGEHHFNVSDDGARLEAIKEAGYNNAKDFIEDVSKNWNEIREGTGTSKWLIKRNGKAKMAAIELKSDDNGNYYTVITGGVFREGYANSKKLLRKRGAPSLDRPELSTPIPYDTSNNAQEGITERSGTSSPTPTIPQTAEPVKKPTIQEQLNNLKGKKPEGQSPSRQPSAAELAITKLTDAQFRDWKSEFDMPEDMSKEEVISRLRQQEDQDKIKEAASKVEVPQPPLQEKPVVKTPVVKTPELIGKLKDLGYTDDEISKLRNIEAQWNAAGKIPPVRPKSNAWEPSGSDSNSETPTHPADEAGIKDMHAGLPVVTDKAKEAAKEFYGHIKDSWDEIKNALAPTSAGFEAKTQAGMMREAAANMARKMNIAETALAKARNAMSAMPMEDRLAFIRAVEQGKKGELSPELQEVADKLKELLDQRVEQVRALGTGKLKTLIENYFPHIWENAKKAADVAAELFSKGPIEGGKSFLKKRTVLTVDDGIERGLKLKLDNPIDMVIYKLREMDKYIMAHRVLNEMKARGYAKFVRPGESAPAGWEKINDRIATVFGPREIPTGQELYGENAHVPSGHKIPTGPRMNSEVSGGGLQMVKVPGQVIMGNYYAPKNAARIINNYLSPGLRDMSKVFETYLGAGNVLNQFQLGFSAWHASTSTINAMLNQFALGLEKVFGKGDWKEGVKDMATSIAAPVTDYRRGLKLQNEWNNPTGQGEVGKIAQALEMAGGRAGQDSFYQTKAAQKFMDAYKQSDIAGMLWHGAPALTELAAKPIMEKLVPRLKLGAFWQLADMEMKRNPNMTHEQLRDVMGKAWDSIDNRMGQVVYDNIFWNKITKDLMMASVRSVGWTGGTIREIGGAGIDTVKAGIGVLKGQKLNPDMFTHKMAYAASLALMTGIMGAATQNLLTGKGPDSSSISTALTDLYYPKTGNLDLYGNPERISYPTYIKDVVSYGKHPGQTITNKVHPLLSLISDMLNNKDFYGTKVYNEGDPLTQKAIDLAKHAGAALEPFASRGFRQNLKNNFGQVDRKTLLPFIGITPAPADINKTDAQKLMDEEREGRAPVGGRKAQDQAKVDMKLQIERLMRKNPQAGQQLLQQNQSKFSPREMQNIEISKTMPPYTAAFKRLPIEDALKVYEKGTPAEKKEYLPMIGDKLKSLQNISADRRAAVRDQLKRLGMLK